MTKPKLRKFKLSDLDGLVNRDGAQAELTTMATQANTGPCFTAECDGVVIGCGGVAVLWEGVGMCWLVLSHEIDHHAVWLSRTAKVFLDQAKQDLKLHRLEATAVHDSLRNQRWLELLGFSPECGVAKNYLPDKRSVVRYEMVEG